MVTKNRAFSKKATCVGHIFWNCFWYGSKTRALFAFLRSLVTCARNVSVKSCNKFAALADNRSKSTNFTVFSFEKSQFTEKQFPNNWNCSRRSIEVQTMVKRRFCFCWNCHHDFSLDWILIFFYILSPGYYQDRLADEWDSDFKKVI